MSEQVDAIYDRGVLKPLEPLVLPDQARVKVTVESDHSAPPQFQAEPAMPELETLSRQQAALEELRREVDRLPQHRNNDGWSVRQHDQLLYGANR